MIVLSDVRQTEKGKHHRISLRWGILENDTNELTYKTETDSQTEKTNLRSPEGKGIGQGEIRNSILTYPHTTIIS